MRSDAFLVRLTLFSSLIAIQARVHFGNRTDLHHRNPLADFPIVEKPWVDPVEVVPHEIIPPDIPDEHPQVPDTAPDWRFTPDPLRPTHIERPTPAPNLPQPLEDAFPDIGKVFQYDGYENNNHEALFLNFNAGQGVYFEKMLDVFVHKKYAVTPAIYEHATGAQQPFTNGQVAPTGQRLFITQTVAGMSQPQTTTFNPSHPTDVCGTWASLAYYCGSAGTECACYSASFLVPDQWNSMAAYCASGQIQCDSPDSTSAYWCSVADQARAYTSYCPTNPAAHRFAAQIGTLGPNLQVYQSTMASESSQSTMASMPSVSGPPQGSQPNTSSQSTHSYSPWLMLVTLALSYGMLCG